MIKTLFTFIFICILATILPCAASDANFDSLKSLAAEQVHNKKVDALNALSHTYLCKSVDSALTYSRTAYKLSHSLDYKSGMAKALLNSGECMIKLGKTSKSIEYLKNALDIYKKNSDPAGMAYSYYLLGRVCCHMQQIPAAMSYSAKALMLGKYSGDSGLYYCALRNIASLYFDIGDYSNSAAYLLNYVSASKRVGKTRGLSQSYFNLARCYHELKDFGNSIKYNQKALDISGRAIQSKTKANIYNQISLDYLELNEFTRALDCQDLHLSQAQHINDSNSIRTSYLNFGKIFLKKGDFGKAKSNLDKSLAISEAIKDSAGIAEAYYMLGFYCIKTGSPMNAVDFMNKALDLYKSFNLQERLVDVYSCLSDIHASNGDLRKALYFHKLSSDTDKKITEESNRRLLSAEKAKFAAEKDMLILKALFAEKESKFDIMLVSVLMALLVLIISLVSYIFHIKKNSKLLISNERMTEYHLASENLYKWISDDFRNALACLAISIDSVSSGKNSTRLNNDYNRISKIYNYIIMLLKKMKEQ